MGTSDAKEDDEASDVNEDAEGDETKLSAVLTQLPTGDPKLLKLTGDDVWLLAVWTLLKKPTRIASSKEAIFTEDELVRCFFSLAQMATSQKQV